EVPVTRLRPSWPLWRGCTLQPGAALARVMVRQALARPQAFANIITHSWGAGALRGDRFNEFLVRTRLMIKALDAEKVTFVTLGEMGARAR
ncbi:MAG: hypothetical protein M3R55_14190, partial [Acidobacteriota bacterium]|nr:hypothetical protein [Acidobacteriota bacterium]